MTQTMARQELHHLPALVLAHVLRDTAPCAIVRLAHMSRALHARIMGTASCHCVRDPTDDRTHTFHKSDFWVHWRDHGMALTDDLLVECCLRRHATCVRVLLALGVDPARNYQEALLEACTRGHTNVVRELLHDARIDPSRHEQGALSCACDAGRYHVVALLLADARVDPRANDHESVRDAARNGHTDVLALLLRDGRADPRADRQYALRTACHRGDVRMVDLLVRDRRIDPAADGQRAVLLACANGHAVVVDRLLRDRRVSTWGCVDMAISNDELDGRHAAVVERLLREPRTDATSFDCEDTMDWASCHGHLSIVERLLQFPDIRYGCCTIRRSIATATRADQHAVVRRLVHHARTVPFRRCFLCQPSEDDARPRKDDPPDMSSAGDVLRVFTVMVVGTYVVGKVLAS